MDKLEHYLDQVCRGLGGSRAMRQHIRQELREHLSDAIAERRAAGMSEEEALARALEDFGAPDEVRSELEATHGHRLMAVVIDKAIEWKEKTMKAKWLWLSWAHVALAAVILVAGFTIVFSEMFLVPKFRQIARVGWLHPGVHDPGAAWLFSILSGMDWLSNHAPLILLGVGILWVLFEWRVRSENKTFMRLSALGTAAVGLVVAVMLTTGSMLILMMLGWPGSVAAGERVAVNTTVNIDAAVVSIDGALETRDWEALKEEVRRVSSNLRILADLEKRAPRHQEKPPQLATHIQSAQASLQEAREAVAARDAERFAAALKQFKEAYATPREWATGLKE